MRERLAYAIEISPDDEVFAGSIVDIEAADLRAILDRVSALEGALEAILALDGPYCDNCHSAEIGEAFRIARTTLTGEA